jgi:retron-type reverse transcriptase
MVVKQLIEPDLDPIFLKDSYGYRPGKSALDAVGVTRERCWRYDWVLEFDIKGAFCKIRRATRFFVPAHVDFARRLHPLCDTMES